MALPGKDPEDELAGTEQPFVSHLVELRDRMIRALVAVGICFGVLSVWPGPSGLYDVLAAPLVAHLPHGSTLIATNVISPFLVPLKITLMAAFMLALPVVLYQLWAFVAPGLYTHEKKLVLPLVVSSTLLFFAGVAFCYFFVFGAAFELPIVVVVLARIGLVSIDKLKSFRSYFIVLAFIIAAILTPPDVVSQLALAIPMVLLYEIGIWAAQLFIKHTQAPAEETTTAP